MRDSMTVFIIAQEHRKVCIYAQLLAVLAAILVFHQPLIGKVLCALTCIQSLVYTGCYWYYNRKY